MGHNASLLITDPDLAAVLIQNNQREIDKQFLDKLEFEQQDQVERQQVELTHHQQEAQHVKLTAEQKTKLKEQERQYLIVQNKATVTEADDS